jgi:hypothetical protein
MQGIVIKGQCLPTGILSTLPSAVFERDVVCESKMPKILNKDLSHWRLGKVSRIGAGLDGWSEEVIAHMTRFPQRYYSTVCLRLDENLVNCHANAMIAY